MSKYKILPLNLVGKDAFTEASKEELRVLLALISQNGKELNEEEIAKIAGTSKARALSSIVYWQEAEIIREIEKEESITYEFEKKIRSGEITDDGSLKVAKTIRNENLQPLLAECEEIMGRTLNSTETKEIVALHTQYGLDDEYIATLASYIAKTRKLSPRVLVNRALKLVEREIDSADSLKRYIEERESESESEYEFRKLFGIKERALSKSEKEYFAKWSKDYGYFTNIVGEAYDIAVIHTRKASLSYIDKILKSWHDAGCKTVEDCRKKQVEEKEIRKSQSARANSEKEKDKTKERYGNFDIHDAFAKALERSYGKK